MNLKKENKTLCHYHQWDAAEEANRSVKLGVSERTPATGSVPILPLAYHAQNECPVNLYGVHVFQNISKVLGVLKLGRAT